MHLLGIDLGSSFVKASIINVETGACVGLASCPTQEMAMISHKPGWAEQNPEVWWTNTKAAVRMACTQAALGASQIKAIGISYQMHGLVVIDKNGKAARDAIIWCDGRAVDIGNKAFASIGPEVCLKTLLNSPGNFTASKMKWVKDNEPDVFDRAKTFCLPGDYIAYRLTGLLSTTVSGLSEGMLWDFQGNKPSHLVLDEYGIPESMLPELVPTFGNQGVLTAHAAEELGLMVGIPLCYRAGDQPNNAFSLNVLNPGEAAATAGTSGVVYGVTDSIKVDTASRVNTFAHVNHCADVRRLGVLLCVNGTGIAQAWTKRLINGASYSDMNAWASEVPIGSEGLLFVPFGNGAERILENQDIGATMLGLRFNTHSKPHFCRAVQEGVAFALAYGITIMKSIGAEVNALRAGNSNMFLSPVFRNTLSTTLGVPIDLYNTDGAQGAARGAGVGAGIYGDFKLAFKGLQKIETVEPQLHCANAYAEAFGNWTRALKQTKELTNK